MGNAARTHTTPKMARTYTGPADYEARNPYLVVIHTQEGSEIDKAFPTRRAAQNYVDRLTVSIWAEVLTRRQFASQQAA